MLGILCGLESEAKIARLVPGALVACAAARPHKARDLARELLDQGAKRLMSFGIAGSLENAIQLGDLFVGSRVASPKGDWACDSVWGDRLMAQLPQAKRGAVYGSEFLVATVAEKNALHRATETVIVDMESQCAAEVAAEKGIPLMVLRAVCDTASMPVPPIVMASIAEDGSVNVPRALSHLLCHPSEIRDLFAVMRGTGKALNALKKAAGDLS